MLNAAMVLMILAGIFGFPAVMCSAVCAGASADLAEAAGEKNPAQGALNLLAWGSIVASAGSIVVGVKVKRLRRATSVISCFLFAGLFALLLLQLNWLGLGSAILLVIAGVMIAVAPANQFRDVIRVETVAQRP